MRIMPMNATIVILTSLIFVAVCVTMGADSAGNLLPSPHELAVSVAALAAFYLVMYSIHSVICSGVNPLARNHCISRLISRLIFIYLTPSRWPLHALIIIYMSAIYNSQSVRIYSGHFVQKVYSGHITMCGKMDMTKGGANMGATYNEAQKKATMKYLKEKTDDVRIRVPKGAKDRWREYAESQGKSLNQFIIDVVEEKIGGSAEA